MLKFLLSAFVLAGLSISPALAQGDADPTYQQRVELAQQMHEIWPVRTEVERALEIIAEDMKPEERLPFKAAMRKAIQYDRLEEDSIAAMAGTFTAQELQAMVNFYGSPEGRAVSAKIEDYKKALNPSLVKMLDKAILDIKTGSAPGDMP